MGYQLDVDDMARTNAMGDGGFALTTGTPKGRSTKRKKPPYGQVGPHQRSFYHGFIYSERYCSLLMRDNIKPHNS